MAPLATRTSASCARRAASSDCAVAPTWRDFGGVEGGILAVRLRVARRRARRTVARARPAAGLAARPSRRHDFSKLGCSHPTQRARMAGPCRPPGSSACGSCAYSLPYWTASPRLAARIPPHPVPRLPSLLQNGGSSGLIKHESESRKKKLFEGPVLLAVPARSRRR